MATVQEIISAATIDPALLAALKSAAPEQVGDDLVLRLADGRVFYVDGFFAADETGDGQPPEPGAFALARDVADLLLGAEDIATAAGPVDPALPPGSGTGFQPFPSVAPEPPALADNEDQARGQRDDIGQERADRESLRAKPLYPQEFGNQSTFMPMSLMGIGTISLSAGAAASPSWGGYFSVRGLFALDMMADHRSDGWFAGLTKAFPSPATYQLDTFATQFDPAGTLSAQELARNYSSYLDARNDLAAFVGGRALWANLTPLDGLRDNSVLNPAANTGNTPESIFGGGDVIFGGTLGTDHLYGFAGDDILVGYGGENHLYGGAGDDLLAALQNSPSLVIDGGDGTDTFLMTIYNESFPIFAKDIGTISHIERLLILPEDPANPAFLNEDNGSGRLTTSSGPFVFDIDAQTILDWGGSLIIDSDVADIRLADIDNWTRLPADPADPTHVNYVTQLAGKTISLSILATADQPIADLVLGTSRADQFFLGDRRFGVIDGGAGDDQILGGLAGGPLGVLDLSGPGAADFRNVENFVLHAATDQLILSAGGIDAMTDARNALWVTGDAFGSAAAVGSVQLADASQWTALGYVSVKTDQLFAETRIGEVYGSTIGGEHIYLFVQLGMTQPIVGTTANVDHWIISHAGKIDLPPVGMISDLAIIDMTNASGNVLVLNIAAVADLAGADHSVSIIGDASVDAVEFSDTTDWKFSHLDDGFMVYLGDDGVGSSVELRIATNLAQPYMLPDSTGADLDHLDLTNGHYNILTLSAETVFNVAGADHKLTIQGDLGDTVAFSDPENWHLTGKVDNHFIYQADDGAGHIVELQLGAELGRPLLQPVGTNGDDTLYMVDVQFSDVIDGKGGFDKLIVLDSGQLLLTNEFARNLEALDFHNGFDNSFSVNALTLVTNGINGPLYVTGDAGDVVTFGDPVRWTDTGQTVTNAAVSTHNFHLYQGVYHTAGGDVTVQLALDATLAQPSLI